MHRLFINKTVYLTGKHVIHLGLHDSNLASCTKDALPLAEDTVADVLKEQGYATHLIGKLKQEIWYLGLVRLANNDCLVFGII